MLCAPVVRSATTSSSGNSVGTGPGPPQLTTSRCAPSLISNASVEAVPSGAIRAGGGGPASMTTMVPSADRR